MYRKQPENHQTSQTACRIIRFMVLLGFALLFTSAALAEQTAIDTDAAQALLAAHPGYTMDVQAQWGDTAAAVLTKDMLHILCVAEKQNGSWTVTIDNPTALLQGEQLPSLLLDSDTVLFWYYRDHNGFSEYCAIKNGDAWGTVGLRHLDTYQNGSGVEYLITYKKSSRGMVISKINRVQDENENLLNETADIPIPAESLAPYANLDSFDVNKFPGNFMYTQDWTNPFIRQSAAEQLMPEYSFLGGTIYRDSFEYLMQKPNGDKVFVGVVYNEADGWMLTESTPLPEDILYGCENFSSSLYLPREMLVNVDLFADGTLGVCYLYVTPEDGTGKEMIFLGQNWIADSCMTPETRYFGTHPWSDVTTIDWSTLPMHLQDAVLELDQTGWAMVNNPNPADRLHLRTKPNKSAASLGKYYNGTAVQVLENGETWVKVSVYGVEGYMLKKYLVFGEEMNAVASAALCYTTVSDTVQIYKHPQDAQPFATVSVNGMNLRVIGIVGEEWYHVWFVDSGLSGYIRQSELWAGNG